MAEVVDVVNRALQLVGTRTTITAQQLADNSNNEAKQANIRLQPLRRQLLRMAPWNCAAKTANLTYITSTPGTPENMSPFTPLWQPGQPRPAWAYEYQYPVDCIRPMWIIPAYQTGFANGVPITTAVTGGAALSWVPPIRYVVGQDEFYSVTAASVVSGGTGYAVGDIITLEKPANTEPPIGAPAQLVVLTVNSGAILTVGVINSIAGQSPAWGGSYFEIQSNPQGQGETTGSGTGATFNLTWSTKHSQRVILTNQEFATLVYVKDVTDVNTMDDQFQEAWASILAAFLVAPLTGDKDKAKILQAQANAAIVEARKGDGNEGLTVNDVTPDFVRIRGVTYTEYLSGPYSQGYDWGPMFSVF